jgi:hypothetical protein
VILLEPIEHADFCESECAAAAEGQADAGMARLRGRILRVGGARRLCLCQSTAQYQQQKKKAPRGASAAIAERKHFCPPNSDSEGGEEFKLAGLGGIVDFEVNLT